MDRKTRLARRQAPGRTKGAQRGGTLAFYALLTLFAVVTVAVAARKRSTDVDSSFAVSRHNRLLTLVTCTSGTHSAKTILPL